MKILIGMFLVLIAISVIIAVIEFIFKKLRWWYEMRLKASLHRILVKIDKENPGINKDV